MWGVSIKDLQAMAVSAFSKQAVVRQNGFDRPGQRSIRSGGNSRKPK